MTRHVLVTGAGRGIGKAIALALANSGFSIAVHYRNSAEGAQQVLEEIREIGSDGRLVPFDIANREVAAVALGADMEEHGAYYGAVCNAGIHDDSAFPAMEHSAWDRVIRTNLDGFYNVLHPIVMPMVRTRQGGRIVVLSSVSGLVGNRGQVNYSASKGGLIAASKALAVELATRKITVNCVAPGLIETEMTQELDTSLVNSIVPARRMGQPKEVASLIAFLFSDEAGYITRQVISINGGMI